MDVGISDKDNSKGGYYGYVNSPSQGSGNHAYNHPHQHQQLNGSSSYNNYNNSSGSNGRNSEVGLLYFK